MAQFKIQKWFFLISFLIVLKCSTSADGQVVCEKVSTRKVSFLKSILLRACRMDKKTKVKSNNVFIATKRDEAMTEIYTVKNTNIDYIPIRIYENFPNLVMLSLSECNIQVINKDIFKNLVSLRGISVENNQIQTVDVGTFDELINLEVLFLNGNSIKSMQGIVFQPLVKMVKLLLSDNNCIDEDFVNKNLAEVMGVVQESCQMMENYEACLSNLSGETGVFDKIRETCPVSALDAYALLNAPKPELPPVETPAVETSPQDDVDTEA